MVARGRKLANLHGFHHRGYNGKGEALSAKNVNLFDKDEESYPINTVVVGFQKGMPFFVLISIDPWTDHR
jgi:hypothetical protein